MSTPAQQPVAIVTGGAVRLGAAISRCLAGAGFAVAVNHHASQEAAEALCAELQEAGATAWPLRHDVTSADAAEAVVEATVKRAGRLDLLVNNAAIFERRDFLQLDEEIWERHLRLNLEAPFRLSLAAARHMSAQGGGRIVNICGTVGIHPRGEFAPYCVAKEGLDTLTRCMAEALAPDVQVNGVAPGAILFPEGTPSSEREAVLARVPAGHRGDPDDVARTVLFLAQGPAYITGVVIPVDGGASLVAG